MAFVWHKPRKKTGSLEPRITITTKYISLNPASIEKYFKDEKYIRIGYDKENRKLIIVPVEENDDHKMTLIKNRNSKQVYINAGNFLKSNGLVPEKKLGFKCSWDDTNKGVLIDLINDRVNK